MFQFAYVNVALLCALAGESAATFEEKYDGMYLDAYGVILATFERGH
jgi:hypothetical protein